MKWRPSPAMAVALVALFVALAGPAIGKKGNSTVKLPPNSVGSAQIKPNAVKTSEIASNAVKTRALAPAAVTTEVIAPNSIGAPALKPGSVGKTKITDGAVGPAQIEDNAITAPKIDTGAIIAGKIANSAVTSGALAPEAVTTEAIAPNSVGAPAIKPGAVGKTKLTDEAVGPAQIENGAITAPKIGPQAVLESKIAGNAVGTGQISNAIPSAAASMTSNTTIPANPGGPLCITFVGCFTGLNFNTEVFDAANMHDPSNGRYLRAPVDGIYQVTATISWANDGCDGIRVAILDGRQADDTTLFLPSDGIWKADTVTPGTSTDQILTGMVQLQAGESVGVIVATNTDMSCTDTSISQGRSTLAMNWLAPGP